MTTGAGPGPLHPQPSSPAQRGLVPWGGWPPERRLPLRTCLWLCVQALQVTGCWEECRNPTGPGSKTGWRPGLGRRQQAVVARPGCSCDRFSPLQTGPGACLGAWLLLVQGVQGRPCELQVPVAYCVKRNAAQHTARGPGRAPCSLLPPRLVCAAGLPIVPMVTGVAWLGAPAMSLPWVRAITTVTGAAHTQLVCGAGVCASGSAASQAEPGGEQVWAVGP